MFAHKTHLTRASFLTALLVLFLAGCSTFSEEQPSLLVDGKGAEVSALAPPTVSGTIEISVYNSEFSEVEYYVDNPQMQGEPWTVSTEYPFTVKLDTTELEDGQHIITALAYTNRGVDRLRGSFTVNNTDSDSVDPPGEDPTPPSDPDPTPPSDPDPTPPSDDTDEPQSDMATQMLALVNNARSTGYDCGRYGYFDRTTDLELDSSLNQAAKVQADHLANRSLFGHVGPGGNTASDRVSATDYNGFFQGENVAAGQDSVEEVVQGWLESDGHCRNIMNPNAREMGAAATNGESYGKSPDGSITWYRGLQWAQVFATPR